MGWMEVGTLGWMVVDGVELVVMFVFVVTNDGTASAGLVLGGDLVEIVDCGAPGCVPGGDDTELGTAEGAGDGLEVKT